MLLRCQSSHYDQVYLGGLPVDTRVRQHYIVNEDNRVRGYCSDSVLQDKDGFVLRVVVDDIVYVVDPGTSDGLWLEEVLYNNLDAWVLDSML
jgi:hypothetical protein